MSVQPVLRYVDADEDLFHDPSLQIRSRAADQGTVRNDTKAPARRLSLLSDPLSDAATERFPVER